MAESSGKSSGIGFCGLLAIAFIVLKLTHFINWSWFYVLLPVIIPIAIVAVLLLIMGVVLIFAGRK